MGIVLSKWNRLEDDLRDFTENRNLSCDHTEYWIIKEKDFHESFFNNNNNNNNNSTNPNDNTHKTSPQLQAKASDFKITTLLDEGSFGSVALATHKKTGKIFATKVIPKKKIVKNEILGQMYNEKRILESINFQFVVHLEYFYQDHSFLYFVMPFMCGGNLFTHGKRYGPMDDDKARFYASETLLAIEYLHRLDLVHRDIKPENILIGVHGHAQLADFGFCKHITGRTFTFCGTPEYIAPEIILKEGYGKSVDYWAFGVLLFEMVVGYAPFIHRDLERLFRSIIKGKYICPRGMSGDLMNLLRNLLKVDVTKRYGNLANGVQDIKRHRWFQSIDWCALFNCQVTPPFVPSVSYNDDTSNFNKLKSKTFLPTSKDEYGDKFKDF